MARRIVGLWIGMLIVGSAGWTRAGQVAGADAPEAEQNQTADAGEEATEKPLTFERWREMSWEKKNKVIAEASPETLLDLARQVAGIREESLRYRWDIRRLVWMINDRLVEDLRKLRRKELQGYRLDVEGPMLKDPALRPMTFPRIDGSTSSWPLRMVLVCRALGCPYEWYEANPKGPHAVSGRYEGPPADVTTTTQHIRAADKTRGRNRLAAMVNQLIVKSSGTHGSWENLGKNKTDLVIAARPPSQKEIAAAAENGVKYEYRPVALGAFVFIVNRVNPVESLTLEQIRAIYTDKTTDWKDLGGREGKITAYQRNPDSGSQPLMEKLVMRGQDIKPPLRREIAYTMGGPYNLLHLDGGGISYSVYYYDRFMTPSALTRTLKIAGVAPNNRTIADGSYPVVSKVWAGIRADADKAGATRKFYDWLFSPQGQAVVAEAGYVPISKARGPSAE